MAKRVGEVNDAGQVKTGDMARVRTTEIPWTRGPQTRGQKIRRALGG